MADSIKNVATIEQADALCAEGKWGDARALYSDMLEATPNDVGLWQHYLEQANSVGDYVEVIRCYMALAEVLAQNGEYDKARSEYQEIISLENQAKSGEIAGHNDVLNKVAAIKAEIFAKLGYLDMWESKAEEAVDWLRASLDLDPSRWDTHMGRPSLHGGESRQGCHWRVPGSGAFGS